MVFLLPDRKLDLGGNSAYHSVAYSVVHGAAVYASCVGSVAILLPLNAQV